jgi:hypothetical protein
VSGTFLEEVRDWVFVGGHRVCELGTTTNRPSIRCSLRHYSQSCVLKNGAGTYMKRMQSEYLGRAERPLQHTQDENWTAI